MTDLLCTDPAIHSFSSYNFSTACQYVQQACADQTALINFFNFYYCDIDQSLPVFIPISIILILLIFYSVSSTAEDYLEPAVSKISNQLKLSESLAGVTLVALANGAPDVIAAFAAGGNANEGVLVPLGGLLGAGVFSVGIVMGACILVSRSSAVRTEKEAVTRDCIFYLIGVLYVLMLGFIGEINLLATLGFLGQYFVFIAVVLYQEAQYRKEQIRQKEILAGLGPSQTVTYKPDAEGNFDLLDTLVKEDHVPTLTQIEPELMDDNEITLKENQVSLISDGQKDTAAPRVHWKYYLYKHKIWQEFQDIANKSWTGKVLHIILYPLKLVRDLTIPACYSDQWSKAKAMAQPFTISIFFLWQFELLDILTNGVVLGVYIIGCFVISFLIWKMTPTYEVPTGSCGSLMMMIAFISSVIWINLIATILVDFIALLDVFTNLPLNYLGLTLVAFGGSIPDFFINLTLARKGLGQTATSGIFAGQYFNIGIGFGIALTRQVLAYGPKPFSLLPTSNTAIINLILIGCLLLSVAVTMIYGYKNNYVFKKGFAVFCLLLYASFFVSVTALSI